MGDDERARTETAELLKLSPDVILANSVGAVRAAQQATRTIPIVFTAVSEPVAQGFVAGLAHPGANITGFTNLEPSVGGKWLELLKEIAPRVTRVAFIFNPRSSPVTSLFIRSAEVAAPNFAVETVEAPVKQPAEIEAVMARIGREPGGGLILPPDTFTSSHHKLIVDLASRYKLPAIYALPDFAVAGGLASYGPDVTDQFRRAAAYVDRILRGEKPGDLPVQQPTKFEFVINLKTAKELGLEVPNSIQLLADEVIE
jgi:putative ABC transport system substrate-binding protein